MAAGETLVSRREKRRRKRGREEKERERERIFTCVFGGKVKVDTHEFGGLRRQHVRVLY